MKDEYKCAECGKDFVYMEWDDETLCGPDGWVAQCDCYAKELQDEED